MPIWANCILRKSDLFSHTPSWMPLVQSGALLICPFQNTDCHFSTESPELSLPLGVLMPLSLWKPRAEDVRTCTHSAQHRMSASWSGPYPDQSDGCPFDLSQEPVPNNPVLCPSQHLVSGGSNTNSLIILTCHLGKNLITLYIKNLWLLIQIEHLKICTKMNW